MPLADLLGQDLVRERLSLIVRSDRLPPALLFVGPPGVGKASAALLLVEALNCPEKVNGDACGHCPSCLQIRRQRYPDLLLVEPEKRQIKIDQIREIQEFISFVPMVGARRIVIIKDAHLLNQTAANALLKTLEEPAATVSFILLSHCHNLLPATVLSRCLVLPFVALSGAIIMQILARQRGAGEVAEVPLEEAAAWSGGSMERARFFLEVENLRWGKALVERFASLPGRSLLQALDLAEEVSVSESLEVVFFVLHNFLHDSLLFAQGLQPVPELNIAGAGPAAAAVCAVAGWSDQAGSFAALGIAQLLAIRQQILDIERGQAVNINLKLAFEALFSGVATGCWGSRVSCQNM
ncbi:MAG: DNA polymerase III subunit delta' [Deltaproteobacteria bacterium]|nr:DNA polymerase III subunit delta' [Deltaproteobacteria bacterium]